MPGRIKPSQKAVKEYYDRIARYREHGVTHEGAVSTAFQSLLEATALPKWRVVPQDRYPIGTRSIYPDATIYDEYQRRGFWEAKDTRDDLDAEIVKKRDAGYPLLNIIFEDTERAVLYQDGGEVMRVMLDDPKALCDLLNRFYDHTEPLIEEFHRAVDEFKERVPDLAMGLVAKIQEAHGNNPAFQSAFEKFFQLCQTSLNPNISVEAVDEMLVQHLLTERLIRTVFGAGDFVRRNVIAAEVENVIDALVAQAFAKHEFLKSLDRFYVAIEENARQIADFTEKQHFINTVYERFFQGYSVKTADTHGIVYTPQPIVDFMCLSVEHVLKTEFGTSLGGGDVVILDPCTGTGNFIVNLLDRIPKERLAAAYATRLFANEVMLLPYYIAALNIEHRYYELTQRYEPFEGLCFVDTLDMAEAQQLGLFTERNTERVQREKDAPITVIIGNPPYSGLQVNENDNNKNRKYDEVDRCIRQTYARDSNATLKAQLYDMYVRFFRWATDRLANRDGIVCFVSNNGFLDGVTFDGFRKALAADFTDIYHFDLKGNARTSGERRRREAGNVFDDQIRVGIGITLLVRRGEAKQTRIRYHAVADYLRSPEKRRILETVQSVTGVEWKELTPDDRHTWLVPEDAEEFASFMPMGDRDTKGDADVKTVFRTYSGGLKTNRDMVVYDFDRRALEKRMERFIADYNAEVRRYQEAGNNINIDNFVDYNVLKWDGTLKGHLRNGKRGKFTNDYIRNSLYRPFSKRYMYFDRLLINSVYLQHYFFPTPETERENVVINVSDVGFRAPIYTALVSQTIPDIHLCAAIDAHQTFPFYVYDEDGSNRRENITDWAVNSFRVHYGDASISKWDVFWYVYGVLHHPGYRERFADNLKKELPRIPYAPRSVASLQNVQEFAEANSQSPDAERMDPTPALPVNV